MTPPLSPLLPMVMERGILFGSFFFLFEDVNEREAVQRDS
jgi:hypothetical protein